MSKRLSRHKLEWVSYQSFRICKKRDQIVVILSPVRDHLEKRVVAYGDCGTLICSTHMHISEQGGGMALKSMVICFLTSHRLVVTRKFLNYLIGCVEKLHFTVIYSLC